MEGKKLNYLYFNYLIINLRYQIIVNKAMIQNRCIL